jgi:uncharacterized membrane protein
MLLAAAAVAAVVVVVVVIVAVDNLKSWRRKEKVVALLPLFYAAGLA